MLDRLSGPGLRWGALALSVVLLTAACQPWRSDDQRPTPLLLISIDGFRHDYMNLSETPALDRLVAGGFKADSLYQVFPTKTFPTHYSIVTGLHPGTHGVVANSMWDPLRDARFSLGNRDAVGDGFWYQAAEPIWVTAERQGLTAATFSWPGSEARIRRVRPSFWKYYDGSISHADRIQQVLEWVDLPVDQRPDFLTLYFSAVDSAGHRHGPNTDPVAASVSDVDHHLGVLLDQLEQRDMLDRINILVVSDHGMERIDFDRYILLDDYLDLSRVRVSDWGPAAQIWASDLSADEIVQALDGAHPHMKVWRREDIPERYHFDQHHRVPDVLAEADTEWMISNAPYMAGRSRFSLLGMHGWDPAWRAMQGIFIAHGPGFPAGSTSPAVRSVDLYELMAHLLQLDPADNQGSLAPFLPFLDNRAEPVRERIFDCAGETLIARIGPAHLSLQWQNRIYVLDAVPDTEPAYYRSTGARFEMSQTEARVDIDGRPRACQG